MTISKNVNGQSVEMFLEGRLDTTTAPQLDAALKDILPSITALKLNFSKLEYISSAGLRVLLATQKALNAKKGSMVVCNVNETISEVFEVTGFSDILTVE